MSMFAWIGSTLAPALAASFLLSILGLAHSPGSSAQKEKAVPVHATGGFDVKLTPETLADKSADATLGRMSLDKQFHGDLEGTSKGEMLTASTSVKGSVAYVALTCVTGRIRGRQGSF